MKINLYEYVYIIMPVQGLVNGLFPDMLTG